MLLAAGSAILGTAALAVVPVIQRAIIDDVILGGASGAMPALAAALLGAAALAYGATFVRRYFGGRMSLDVQFDLRTELFAALSRLDGARQDQLHTGQVVGRSISDITMVQGLLQMMPMMTSHVLLFFASLVIMTILSPLLTVIALAMGPGLWLVAQLSRRRLFPASWAAQQQSGQLAGVVDDAVAGVRVVKGFGQEAQELGKLEQASRQLYALRMRVVRFTSRYNPALQAVPALGQVGVLLLGGWLALRGSITLGTFLAFTTYLAQLVGPVRMLAGLLTVGQQAKASVIRVFEVIDSEPLVADAPDAVRLEAGRCGIEFDEVSFGYDGDNSVLDGLSLRVAPGETVALMGPSGSGKSTISMLLPRFYDVDKGMIRVGGHDVRDVTRRSLRGRIGLVMADSFLFSDTIRANIAYGRPDATDEDIEAAAKAAEADEFIRALPGAYHTVVGEQGLSLSGGQRQRISIARALLTDPDVLILDDATSAVDARIEAEIHATLRHVMAGRTTLLIAHRRSTLNLADRIVVLERGRVVDTGTHEELEDRCALYRRLLRGDPSGAQPENPSPVPTTRTMSPDAATGRPYQPGGATVGRAGGARMGAGPLAGHLAGVPPSPELLTAVDALPAALDVPDVDPRRAAAPDGAFTLRRTLRPFNAPLAVSFALVALTAASLLALPLLVRHGIDAGVGQDAFGVIAASAAVGLAVVLAGWAAMSAQTMVAGRTGERLLYTLRVKAFAQLQRLGLDFYERELSGRIMTRMTTDIDALANFLQTGLATAAVSVLSFFGVMTALLVINAQLALVVMSVLPVLLAATLRFRSRSTMAYDDAREKVGIVNAELAESVAGLRVTQAYRRETHNQQRFAARSDEYRSARLRSQRYIALYFPFVQFLATVASLLTLMFGAGMVQDGTLTPGALIAYLLYIELLFSPVQQLSQVFDSYQQAAVGLRRIRDLLRLPTSTPRSVRPVPVPERLTGRVELENVSFRYDQDAPEALSEVSLTVEPGQTVALVGETGAGKSTLVKLVARFYDPTGGRVCVDGVDLRDYALASYRHRLGVVPQEAYLFPGTIRDAIAYGRPDAPESAVEAAARAVGAHGMIINLTGGYEHRVEERGRNLSSGQRQLIALARAQLVDPDILLLDEATAALDLATETAVLHATDALIRRRTTLVVAHRLTTAARADRIVVFDHGHIAETGAHDDLLAADGRYAQMWRTFAHDRPNPE